MFLHDDDDDDVHSAMIVWCITKTTTTTAVSLTISTKKKQSIDITDDRERYQPNQFELPWCTTADQKRTNSLEIYLGPDSEF